MTRQRLLEMPEGFVGVCVCRGVEMAIGLSQGDNTHDSLIKVGTTVAFSLVQNYQG